MNGILGVLLAHGSPPGHLEQLLAMAPHALPTLVGGRCVRRHVRRHEGPFALTRRSCASDDGDITAE
ncbi:hypothetical protein [Streptomyces spiralis]|uniref:hypothetical protein n=1 Tax=Streptomyces spiralis TaxID=66376 RepID=UPI003680B060